MRGEAALFAGGAVSREAFAPDWKRPSATPERTAWSRQKFAILNRMIEKNRNAEELSQEGIELLAEGRAAEAARAFRAAMAADERCYEAHHGLVRALRDAGQVEQSIGVALALTALTPEDPLAHTALSISLQAGGHVPEAEAAAARARILEWKQQLRTPGGEGNEL
jgi:thioredoxin-like negative regulator of GroEL